ncbi:MAG: DUF971 domain-containing protein [Magnetococcales bacterium]|nr:DUF971 domain-containing protein [Magnetococcales bacterium]
MSYGSKQIPTEIRQVTAEKLLRISWDTGEVFDYTMEYLRVMCPCAGCSGHTPAEAKLIDGQQNVTIKSITPTGRYAIKIEFSDDHDTGLYSWETLYDLGSHQEVYWKEYLAELEKAGKRRRPSVFAIKQI